MDKLEIAKQIFSEKDYEIFSRTQLRMDNTYVKIGKDLGITKQAIQQRYKNLHEKVNRIFNNL